MRDQHRLTIRSLLKIVDSAIDDSRFANNQDYLKAKTHCVLENAKATLPKKEYHQLASAFRTAETLCVINQPSTALALLRAAFAHRLHLR